MGLTHAADHPYQIDLPDRNGASSEAVDEFMQIRNRMCDPNTSRNEKNRAI